MPATSLTSLCWGRFSARPGLASMADRSSKPTALFLNLGKVNSTWVRKKPTQLVGRTISTTKKESVFAKSGLSWSVPSSQYGGVDSPPVQQLWGIRRASGERLKSYVKKGLVARGDSKLSNFTISLWQATQTAPKRWQYKEDGSKETSFCPSFIAPYNKYMRGVDCNSHIRGYYHSYMYIFWFLFNIQSINQWRKLDTFSRQEVVLTIYTSLAINMSVAEWEKWNCVDSSTIALWHYYYKLSYYVNSFHTHWACSALMFFIDHLIEEGLESNQITNNRL